MNELERFHYHRTNCAILDMTCQKCEEDCPEAGRRQRAELKAELKAETITSGPRVKKWTGTWPSKCQICPVDLGQKEYFVDGKTRLDYWCLMCPLCHTIYGVGLGLGRGQKYDSKTLEKLEG